MINKIDKKNLVIGAVVAIIIAIGAIAFISREPEPGQKEPIEPIDLINQVDPIDPVIELPRDLYFQTISKGDFSEYRDIKNYVIKNNFEWENLREKAGILVTPNINFDEKKVIAVSMGERRTGGYSIEITRITEKEDYIEVFIRERSPSPENFVTMVITHPYHIVKVERIDKEVRFIRERLIEEKMNDNFIGK